MQQKTKPWEKEEPSPQIKEALALRRRIEKSLYRQVRSDQERAICLIVDEAIRTTVGMQYPEAVNVWTKLNEVMGGDREGFETSLHEAGEKYRMKLATQKHEKELEDIKEVRMAIRMKESDYARLEGMAREKGVKVSALCRNILGNTDMDNVLIDQELKRSFIGMGINLNQLALHYNRTHQTPPEALTECLALLKLLKDAYSRK